ncbi:hypothetical protein [Pseudomonas fragi]|uniref:Uncharacterized protein n=1 Tax=Pseudomonas fragi TaxID=296 RepID=A0A449IFM5_PSEFR|nr:hypothetical protein [Pseudomonas fragi]VFB18302.1 Uncharacterised protein [Pseudomonas fragi]
MPNTFNYSSSGNQPQISPDSPHAQLLTLAKDRGRDVGVIAEMLRFLDVHPQLIDFPRVIQGLVNTLDAMDVPPVLSLGACDLRAWRDECRWIISIRDNPKFIAVLGPMFYHGDEQRTRNPVIGRGVRRRLEALLVLHLMLWFGRSLDDCKKLRIAERNARPSSVLELVLADETGPAEFRFFAPTPDYAAEELLPRDAVRASQPTISVPDMVGAAGLVMAIRDLSPVNGSAVITCKIKDVEREIRTLLSELGGEDPRYTVHKVRSYLHRQIIADSHDVVAATMLSGMPCISANTALYYSQYSINYLRRLYCQSVQRVLAAVYATVGLEAPSASISVVPEVAVGARNCLRLVTVKSNLDALLAVLRKRPRKGLQQLVHWHNCFSLWTVQMFFIATGCRAIRDPLKHEDEFISPGGHGALGDKGSDDGHMSRLVVLTDLLKRQLKAYKAHCRAITGQLELHAPAPTNGFFLRLTDDGCLSYEEIRPLHIKAVMRQIEGFTPHAVNAFRKFLRTELAERGCPPETLSALMGHWLSGEEPQDIYSSFCPRTYVQSLHAHLLPLMRELGWTVRNSHLVMEADV